MKNVVTNILFIIIFSASPHSVASHFNNNFNRRLKSNAHSFRYLYITQPVISERKLLNNDNKTHISQKISQTSPFLGALNPEQAELHPESLSGVESKITPEELENLRKKGMVDGDPNTWRNWHILTKGIISCFTHFIGEWKDVGTTMLPEVSPNLKITEPYALRKPLKYWGFTRGIVSNFSINHSCRTITLCHIP